MKIAVAGTGYVGLSIATLLAQHNEVVAVDVLPDKVDKINKKISPIQDEYIEKYFAEKELNLRATLDGAAAYKDADFVVIAAPTNYDPVKNYFDTSHVEEVIDLVLSVNPDAVMVIKSTIPVGYSRSLYVKYALQFLYKPELKGKKFNLLFSPEFLRESKALYDNLYPSRIIVGYPKLINIDDKNFTEENAAITAIGNPDAEKYAHQFAALLQEGALKENIDTLFYDFRLLQKMQGPAASHLDWQAAQRLIGEADEALRLKLSNQYMDHLLNAVRCGTVTVDDRPVIFQCRHIISLWIAGDQEAVKLKMRRLLNMLDADLEKYTIYGEYGYPVNHHETFQNTQDAPAYIFG